MDKTQSSEADEFFLGGELFTLVSLYHGSFLLFTTKIK